MYKLKRKVSEEFYLTCLMFYMASSTVKVSKGRIVFSDLFGALLKVEP